MGRAGTCVLACAAGWAVGLGACAAFVTDASRPILMFVALPMLGGVPGALVGTCFGGWRATWRSAVGGVIGIPAGLLVGFPLMSDSIPGAIVIDRIVLGNPIAFIVGGAMVGAIWGAAVGGRRFSFRMAIAGAVAGPLGHLVAIPLTPTLNAWLGLWPKGSDPASLILTTWTVAIVLASLVGSAVASAVDARDGLRAR